jgi:hypothetical protein
VDSAGNTAWPGCDGGPADFLEKAEGTDRYRELWVEDLQGNSARMLKVGGEIDSCHAATPKLALDRVMAHESGLEWRDRMGQTLSASEALG